MGVQAMWRRRSRRSECRLMRRLRLRVGWVQR
jgi:hypothetical protein